MDIRKFFKKESGQKRVRGERSLLERGRQKERLREKKVNRQVQVRESKERQRSCSKWLERQRKIKLLQREESKQAKRGKMMKQLQQLILLQGLI
ncbi:genetic suppressor element 1-like [Oreochromis aureus]|uniref:genetic suppressor element 1-like n=1 Tax=Oreochromis aureus TaxID=47969 RepID=UPI001954E5C9|nr:genetic suppressor element 1-like [Oreochromis aureus]